MDRTPALFALPPGVDFVTELLHGIDAVAGTGPLALAGAEVWVNTERTRRRILEIYHQGPSRILPRIRLITELSPPRGCPMPKGVSPLRRLLELRPLVEKLLEVSPGWSPGTSAIDLTESLTSFLTEMADEGVSPEDLAALDIGDTSGHWQNSLAFLSIAATASLQPDRASLQRAIAEKVALSVSQGAQAGPIFLAGSTGSRGPSRILMRALARSGSGYVILPGFDFEMGQSAWGSFEQTSPQEDHPQFRFFRLLQDVGLSWDEVTHWTETKPNSIDRNRLLSLALRPAPVTDTWMRDGPKLEPLGPSCSSMSLIEAETPRSEAGAIALCMKSAIADGKRVALITPDRKLARRVTAALDYWGLIPDDSAGVPLGRTPQGRLILHLNEAMVSGLNGEALFALLSNPVVASGSGRRLHLDQSRSLEAYVRRKEILEPTTQTVRAWAEKNDSSDNAWVEWVTRIIIGVSTSDEKPDLSAFCQKVLDLANFAADGPDPSQPSLLWRGETGSHLETMFQSVAQEAGHGGRIPLSDIGLLIAQLLSQSQVREPTKPHPDLMIWGTLEARVQTVDLAILGGLNEGVWPKPADPDPWLSRHLRHQAGLWSPERRIGLSAHDFQSAASAPEVVFSRPVRDDDAMTVPARWLNRLTNLLQGLPEQGGTRALEEMRDRGTRWLNLSRAMDHRVKKDIPPAPRPSPAPPVSTRPRRLSVTQIKTLIRDPYAIYASKVLGLRPQNSLRPKPDARLRGNVLHKIFEDLIKGAASLDDITAEALLAIADRCLAKYPEFPAATRLWRTALEGLAPEFIVAERSRWFLGRPKYLEVKGEYSFDLASGASFTLSGIADRIDIAPSGEAHIYDYKSGTIPTPIQQIKYDMQLFLLGLMVENGAFSNEVTIPATDVASASFLGVGQNLSAVAADLGKTPISLAFERLQELLNAYNLPQQGYAARAQMEKDSFDGDYDHLSRRGEWDLSTQATTIRLTDAV